MAKGSKPLWGTSKDAWFRRVLRAEPGVSVDAAERLLHRFRVEVVQVRLRDEVQTGSDTTSHAALAPPLSDDAMDTVAAKTLAAQSSEPQPEFDPYTPNVIVLIRTQGRDKALAALATIASVEQLRLLAREQQLSIGDAPATAEDIRLAIVNAADRRVVNRRAAAG